MQATQLQFFKIKLYPFSFQYITSKNFFIKCVAISGCNVTVKKYDYLDNGL